MKLAIIGLGKMGGNMARRLLKHGIEVVGFDFNQDAVNQISLTHGMVPATSVADAVSKLSGEAKKIVWIMLPSGEITENQIKDLVPLLSKGDIIVDGGNSNYKHSQRRGAWLAEHGIDFIDCGTSGGIWGLENGYCLMYGGTKEAADTIEPIAKALTHEDRGWAHVGPIGSGHFTKMIHNGIEYGMMQAIAEGFAVMKASEYDLDLGKVADIYQHRSVIESRLVGWAQSGFKRFGQDLEEVTPTIAHTGEGEWTVNAAKELGIPVPIIEGSFRFRVESAKNPAYTNKVVSMLRHEFGGHATK